MAANNESGPGRREARERAIAILYEAEAKAATCQDILDELPSPPMPYAVALVQGIDTHGSEVDEIIESHSDGWRVARMPALDRAVLRIATYELAYREDVPRAVVLDEAIDMAKDYSTENSGRFVNGVLASVADTVRPA